MEVPKAQELPPSCAPGPPRGRSWVVTLSLILTFAGSSAVQAGVGGTREPTLAMILWGLIVIVGFTLLVFACVHGRVGRPLGTIDFALLLLPATGVGGAVLEQAEMPIAAIGFAVVTLLRLVALFLLLPQVADSRRVDLPAAVSWWACVTTGGFALAMLAISARMPSHDWWSRLSGNQHPNLVGAYVGTGLVLSIGCKTLPRPLRVASFVLASYVLVGSQSRSSMLAAAAAVAALVALEGWRRRGTGVLWVALMIVAASGALIPSLGFIGHLSPVEKVLGRTQAAQRKFGDPTTGRVAIARRGIDRLSESPWVGIGFSQPEARFENGALSLAVETGLIGLTVYCVFFFGLVWVFLSEFRRQRDGPPAFLYVAIALSVFVACRSLGERAHLLQISDPASNVVVILGGWVCHVRGTFRRTR